jgi:hypothetical protein
MAWTLRRIVSAGRHLLLFVWILLAVVIATLWFLTEWIPLVLRKLLFWTVQNVKRIINEGSAEANNKDWLDRG